ncbi:MAG: carboxylating nicotinate-nucleotide diphosphorylase [Oscillospiraceae bacterium]|nr:carboxylating nicotinate-nucleotide diphosphorylase [Oscillospiraceae bacterium]
MILPKLPQHYIDDIVKTALAEDINYIDVATDFLFDASHTSRAELVAKENGVLSGSLVAHFGGNASYLFSDGQSVNKGDIIAKIHGNTADLLKYERSMLNILQHMSGIATETRRYVDAIAGTRATICDTRKTLPGLRAMQKYAVLCGGGKNHRYNLSQAAMLKDNHIDACGGITRAITALRERVGHMVAIEVEVRDLAQLREALDCRADVIMLDNMSVDMMREAVAITAGRTKLESSGNITLENVRQVAETGVDIISVGALTHSVKALDISMRYVS